MGGLQNLVPISKPKKSPAIDYDAIARNQAAEERKALIARNSRGMDDNIKTSYTGVLGTDNTNVKRKNLLGE